MPEQPTDRDKTLRSVLNELSMGRLTVDEAYGKIEGLTRPTVRSSKPQMQSIGVGLFLLLFGAVFGAVGGIFAVKSLSFSHDAVQVEGTVVRHERSGNKGNRIPIVRYTVDGKEHELRGEIASNMPPALHSKVTVLYKTADPSQAQIDSFVQRWLFPLIFGGIGGLAGLIGLVVVMRSIAKRFRSAAGQSERFTV
jgi:hypothetical protein